MKLLDRYVLRNFLEPLCICFLGFIGIWMIFDLYDNGPEFIEYHTSLKLIGRFYLTQLPAVVLLSLPVALLLSLLFSLSKMSRHNEIISMLTAGRSIVRVLIPLMLCGLLASGICLMLNREWAPHAEAVKKQMLEAITRGDKRAEDRLMVDGYLFRNRQDHRTWYVGRLKQGSPELDGLHITQQDAAGNVIAKWYAERGIYDSANHTWTLNRGMKVSFDKSGDITENDSFPTTFRVVSNWSETPWRIASGQFEAQNLSIGELHEYLNFNSDFPPAQLAPFRTNLADRFAFPISCFVVVFIAAPLGIVFSRRGVLAGVSSSIFIFIAMILFRYFVLAMGKGSHLNPNLAAWLPDGGFFLLGLLFLYMRSANRDLRLAFWR